MTLTPLDLSPIGRSIYRPGPWHAGCWPITTQELGQLVSKHPDMQTDALHYVPVAGVLDLPERDLPVHPWVLGLWLGDGHSRSATIYCASEDEAQYRETVYCAKSGKDEAQVVGVGGFFTIDRQLR